jgi:hypothetical protein
MINYIKSKLQELGDTCTKQGYSLYNVYLPLLSNYKHLVGKEVGIEIPKK